LFGRHSQLTQVNKLFFLTPFPPKTGEIRLLKKNPRRKLSCCPSFPIALKNGVRICNV
jgi:hypothetical protein